MYRSVIVVLYEIRIVEKEDLLYSNCSIYFIGFQQKKRFSGQQHTLVTHTHAQYIHRQSASLSEPHSHTVS